MKKAKKILYIIFLSFIITSVLSLISAPALADSPDLAFHLTGISCKPGEEVVAFVHLSNAKGLQAGDGRISFDNKLLEFVSFDIADEAKDAGILLEGGYVNGAINMAYLHIEEVSEDHNNFNLAKITFKAKKAGKGRLILETTGLETGYSGGDISSKIKDVKASVIIGKKVESKNLAGIKESDIDWGGVTIEDLDTEPEAQSFNKWLLVGGIVVVAAIGILVVVTVLKQKDTDVNPNKIDVKK